MKVILIVASTIDGYIARQKKQSSLDWTSQEDKRFFSKKSKQAGVVVMGKTTFTTIGKPLKDRLNIIYTPQTKAEFFQEYGFSEDQYTQNQLQVTALPPVELVAKLAKQGHEELVVCGGASIYHQFLESGLVDELCITIEPLLFGQGISLAANELDLAFELKSCQKLNKRGTLLLAYQKKNK